MAAVPEKRRAAIFSYRYKMLLLLVFQHLHYFFHFFALIPIIFYYEYASRKNGDVSLKRPVILSIAIAVFFIAAFAYFANAAPFYPEEHTMVKNTIFLFNTFV